MVDNMQYIEKIKKGDKIGVISPSAPLAGLVEHRYKNGIEKLEELGFKVEVGKHALDVTSYTAGSAKDRAEDIMNFFKNDEIKAIISFIGGYHSNQILKYLDFDIIKNNPKIVMGYSDMTVLLLAIYKKCNFSTFYGPSVLNQFADPYISDYTLDYFKRATMNIEPIGKILPSKKYTYEFLDWFQKKDLERNRNFIENPGWKWLKEGYAKRKDNWWMLRNFNAFKRN